MCRRNYALSSLPTGGPCRRCRLECIVIIRDFVVALYMLSVMVLQTHFKIATHRFSSLLSSRRGASRGLTSLCRGLREIQRCLLTRSWCSCSRRCRGLFNRRFCPGRCLRSWCFRSWCSFLCRCLLSWLNEQILSALFIIVADHNNIAVSIFVVLFFLYDLPLPTCTLGCQGGFLCRSCLTSAPCSLSATSCSRL